MKVQLKIDLIPLTVSKKVGGLTIEKQTGMSKVVLYGDDSIHRHVGYYVHESKVFSGLINWDNSLNESMAEAIAQKVKEKEVRYSDAPQDMPELTEEDDEDEFE